jgi:hypothetical protein
MPKYGMKTFQEWVSAHDSDLAEAMQSNESFAKWLAPLVAGAGLAFGGDSGTVSPDLVNKANLTRQDVRQRVRFHPYSHRSVPGKDRSERTPDFQAAYQNYQQYGQSGLTGQAEEIFQQMLRNGKFER